MKNLKIFVFSLPLTATLLAVFAVSIGYATFVENDYGTEAAKALVYNALWFEIILAILVINLTGSIFRYKMVTTGKWGLLLFHISFIVIAIGAAITRYAGYEGMMHIREGESTKQMVSDNAYITARVKKGETTRSFGKKVLFSPVTRNRFRQTVHLDGHIIELRLKRFIPNATENLQESHDGTPFLSLVTSDSVRGMNSFFVREGTHTESSGMTFSFNGDKTGNAIFISWKDGSLTFNAPDTVLMTGMGDAAQDFLVPQQNHPFYERTLYKIKETTFVLKKFYASAMVQPVSSAEQEGMDAIEIELQYGDTKETLYAYGGRGYISKPATTAIGETTISISYGSKPVTLPFFIELRDFQLERYPGSNSPSSFASEIVVIDEERNKVMPYRIFMNNVLNYRGYRFFQSSYDKDEMGTILSVNKDAAGTWVTYFGYFIMTLGMIAALVSKKGRYARLSKAIEKLRNERITTTMITLVALSSFTVANASPEKIAMEEAGIDARHAARFGEVLMQDRDGRIKPLNTLASEILRKISHKSSFNGMTPEQVLLGMTSDPIKWQTIPMIRVSNPELASILGINGRYAAFGDIVDFSIQNGYKIGSYVEMAYQKTPSQRNKFDNEVLKVDERVNIAYMVYNQSFLTLFPVPGHENLKWVNPSGSTDYFEGAEGLFVKGILELYLEAVHSAKKSGNWQDAEEYLNHIESFQKKYASDILPSPARVKMEIVYNNINIFSRLSRYYGLTGILLLILHFLLIIRPEIRIKWVLHALTLLVLLLFALHTAGLALRWYVSGYAPWSNGYESMIYIGWATVFAGILFVKKSHIALSATALLASLILFVAGLSWMDPEITTLVPVLQSYWLIVHVAVITASYGFFALCALLGFFNLSIMAFRNQSNKTRLNLMTGQIAHIIGMAVIIGLFLLTIGTFLGGIWANESWGRYWGWDPKETWALVTILVYAIIAHMHLIPGLRGYFAISFAGLLALGSVLMTYFGVNYYLSGLHSYAAGDPVPVPPFVYYAVAIVAAIGITSFLNDRKYGEKTDAI